MDVIELSCPHCAARLRMRDLSFVGRTIDCPDCGEKLQVLRSDAGNVSLIAASAAAAPEGSSVQKAPRSKPTLPRALTPRRIGWGVAVLLAVVIAAFAAFPPSSREQAPPGENSAASPEPQPPPQQPDPPNAKPEELSELEQRLAGLGTWSSEYRLQHGFFPRANPGTLELPPEQRLSWMAELAHDRDPAAAPPVWDRPWNDPLNSRFVRRRMPGFLNPNYLGRDGAEGYPAAHFIGVAGIGADAPALPKDHPRAGIFGLNRSTREQDVRDGLSNTLLLLGREAGFTPWAKGGPAAMQGVTEPPYVHGPDQFGTGQPDGMYVLMADGRVRFLSKDVSPQVFRRMAAMADGLPLDENVPGEPGASPAPPPIAEQAPPAEPPPAAALPEIETRPLDVPVAREPPPAPAPPSYDVERALSQPIARFSQVPAVPFRVLLRQVEEMSTVPIESKAIEAGPLASRMEREVSIELRDTTVGQVLDAIVREAGLDYEAGREFGVRLKPPQN